MILDLIAALNICRFWAITFSILETLQNIIISPELNHPNKNKWPKMASIEKNSKQNIGIY